MVFEVEEMAVRMIEVLQPVLPSIKARDRGLADQLTRAANSVALNVAESNYSDPGNRRARLFTAAGSANEARMSLRIAVASRHCAAADVDAAMLLANRILRILWKLTH